MPLNAATAVTPTKYPRSDCSVRPTTMWPTGRGTPRWRSTHARITGPSFRKKKRLRAVNERKTASDARASTPVATPVRRAWKPLLSPAPASLFACCALSELTPRSWSQPWILSAPCASFGVSADAWLEMPPTTISTNPAPSTSRPRKTSAAPAAARDPAALELAHQR